MVTADAGLYLVTLDPLVRQEQEARLKLSLIRATLVEVTGVINSLWK